MPNSRLYTSTRASSTTFWTIAQLEIINRRLASQNEPSLAFLSLVIISLLLCLLHVFGLDVLPLALYTKHQHMPIGLDTEKRLPPCYVHPTAC